MAGTKWTRRKLLRRAFGGIWQELLLYSLFLNLIMLSLPIFVLQVYDRVVAHAGMTTLQALVAGMAVALLFDFVLRQARSRVLHRVGAKIDADLGHTINRKILALPLSTLEGQPASHWQALYRDVEGARGVLSSAAVLLLFDLPFVFLFFGVIVVIAAPVAWVLLVSLLLLVAIAAVGAAVVSSASRRERKAALERDRLTGEVLAGRGSIKALGLAERFDDAWQEQQAEVMQKALKRGRLADGFQNAAQTIALANTVAITAVGALAILDQQMTIGALVAANILGGRFIAPLVQLVPHWRGFSTVKQSLNRLRHLLSLEEDDQAGLELPRPEGRLALEGVSFGYPGRDRPVIEAMTLKVGPGGLHAVAGANGCGKSTLLKLLLGLYPVGKGRVLLDGAEIGQFSRAQLAQDIGYLPQALHLFDGTIRDNIALAGPAHDDEEVIAAAKRAGVHDAIVDSPQGYNTPVGEAGQWLSGGQRQRIGLARALITDPAVLLLDEPTAFLDQRAEQDVVELLTELARDKTVVVATHSRALLRRADSVVIMNRGRIVRAGRPSDVFAEDKSAQDNAAQDKAQGAVVDLRGTTR